MMGFRPPIGISDFGKLRESGADYVDKTAFVLDVLEDPAEVLLFPRPRRFGKTLNLSTLHHFLDRSGPDRAHLFADLQVWRSEAARAHFRRYPVISLTFKDIKAGDWQTTLSALKLEIQTLFSAHRYLLESDLLADDEADRMRAVLELTDDEALYWRSLRDLSSWLARHHGERVVILIDEYDTPIQTGYLAGFYDEAIRFLRNLLSGGLKDNPHLYKGVLTGVLRVARESLFSGLNNLKVYSILDTRFHTAFGFTELEVARITRQAGQAGQLESLRQWYNGYLFGGEVIYNPWSILSFIHAGDGVCRPWWVSTSSDDLLRELLLERGLGFSREMELLLRGETIDQRIDEDIVLRDVSRRTDALWSFLTFSGYLKVVAHRLERGALFGQLAIPNEEVHYTFREIFQGWMRQGMDAESRVRELLELLLAGDAAGVERLLGELMSAVLSSHDFGPRASEKLYQAFILGLLVYLEPRYAVRSNRESGYGRYDVMLCPREPGRPGVVLELKVVDRSRRQSPKRALEAALEQLRERAYSTELEAAGADPVHALAVAFDGKRVWVRRAEDLS